jgi:hypothetical protein
MSLGDILWWVLMGLILVWAGDMFRVWEPWQSSVERWLNRIRGRETNN